MSNGRFLDRVVLTLVFLVLLTTWVAADLAIGGPIEDLRQGTVVVTDGRGHGSGVVVQAGGRYFVWTNDHVAEVFENYDGSYRTPRIVSGSFECRGRFVRSGDYRAGVDCALIELDIEPDAETPLKPLQFYRGLAELEPGQQAMHCGTPFDVTLEQRILTFGRISRPEKMIRFPGRTRPGLYIQVDLNAGPGCSGGPVADFETGNVIGLLSNGAPINLSYAVHAVAIMNWAARNDCLWAFDPSVPCPSTTHPLPSRRYMRELNERRVPRETKERFETRPIPVAVHGDCDPGGTCRGCVCCKPDCVCNDRTLPGPAVPTPVEDCGGHLGRYAARLSYVACAVRGVLIFLLP